MDPTIAPTPVRSVGTEPSPVIPMAGASLLAAFVAATGAWAGLRVSPLGGIAAAALAAGLAVLLGYGIGQRWGAFVARTQMFLFRIADELAQYRAFTRLLRDQGERITETTEEAARVIVSGLRDMDTKAAMVVARLKADGCDPTEELQRMALSISDPVVEMLGQLQFQDVTRQQLAFLARLSLVVDEHMIALGRELGDRRSLDRVGEFKQMFAQALDDCVMSSQREDHHTASGMDVKEATGPKIELF